MPNPKPVPYDDLRILLEEALALTNVMSSVTELQMPRLTVFYYSGILHEKIASACRLWAQHNGQRGDKNNDSWEK